MLHIVNGDATAETLKRTKIKGEIFSFKDTLITGPAPAIENAREWLALRAKHLAQTYDIKKAVCEQELKKQQQVLKSAAKYDEVVLWFEHDLFCQLNLLYLLNWFSKPESAKTRLGLINIGRFPGRKSFRGLGELTANELASLFPKRKRVTKTQLSLASRAWQAFRSPNPTAVELLLHNDTTELPTLSSSLKDHLYRFPSTRNGLGRIENTSLKLIKGGLEKFTDLFLRFGALEKSYGLGDSQFWATLLTLANAREPLLTLKNADPEPALDAKKIKSASFELTKAGKAVLAGKADFVALNGIDQWLGGVHLVGKQRVWRWHNQSRRLALN